MTSEYYFKQPMQMVELRFEYDTLKESNSIYALYRRINHPSNTKAHIFHFRLYNLSGLISWKLL